MNYELGIRKRKSLLRCHVDASLEKTSDGFNNSTIQQFNNRNFLSKLKTLAFAKVLAGKQNSKPQCFRRGGYALMLSIVVSSIVLSIGISLLNIVQKELILSATGRDSQFAFYAADAGLECVLYWDIAEQAFPANLLESDFVTGPFAPGGVGSDCGHTDFSVSGYGGEIEDVNGDTQCVIVDGEEVCSGERDDVATYTLTVTFTEDSEGSRGTCAIVDITKKDINADGEVETEVDAHGYNEECPPDGGVFTSPGLVERGIKVTYGGD